MVFDFGFRPDFFLCPWIDKHASQRLVRTIHVSDLLQFLVSAGCRGDDAQKIQISRTENISSGRVHPDPNMYDNSSVVRT